jgi:hypothetical protein
MGTLKVTRPEVACTGDGQAPASDAFRTDRRQLPCRVPTEPFGNGEKGTKPQVTANYKLPESLAPKRLFILDHQGDSLGGVDPGVKMTEIGAMMDVFSIQKHVYIFAEMASVAPASYATAA